MPMLSLRVDAYTQEAVDGAAADRRISRSDWLAAVVDRALVGEGRMAPETALERRESRRQRSPVRPAPVDQ